jgi:hypothetical protein
MKYLIDRAKTARKGTESVLILFNESSVVRGSTILSAVHDVTKVKLNSKKQSEWGLSEMYD